MAQPTTIPGDLWIGGALIVGTSVVLPAASIGDEAIAAAAGIQGSKTVHRGRAEYALSTANIVGALTRVLHVAHKAGTVLAFKVGVSVAAIGDSTATFDLKKNGATILSATVTLDSGDAAYAVTEGAITSGGVYVADDVFTLVVTVSAGTGTLPYGLFVEMVYDEDPL